MALTIGTMAQVETQTALAVGNAQASSMGLGKQSAGALSINNMMQNQSQAGLMKKLTSSGPQIGGKTQGGLGLSSSRLRGEGLKNDLMSIGQAALATGPGRGMGLSSSSMLKPTGNVISNKI